MASWLNPKNWLLGIGLLLWRMLSFLPTFTFRPLSKSLGWFVRRVLRFRVRIVEKNLALVAPEKTPEEREKILKGVYASLGMMPFEIAMVWFSKKQRILKSSHFVGLDALNDVLATGQGVLLLAPHFTHLEITAGILGQVVPLNVVYRAHKTPMFDAFVKSSRERILKKLLPREDVRGAAKVLKQGQVLWYAPDQDYRHKMSVFAPFFGINASTIYAPARLVKMSGCAVFVMGARRDNGTYTITLNGPVEGLPAKTTEQSAAIINKAMQSVIVPSMDQYMWLHKRFKTRPEGEASVYE